MELGSGDGFWVRTDLVLVNDFWICISLCALNILASVVEAGCVDDLWVDKDLVFVSNLWLCSSVWALIISASAKELIPVMISSSEMPLFSSMIFYSAALYVSWRFLRLLSN